jgi:hypothetical protein
MTRSVVWATKCEQDETAKRKHANSINTSTKVPIVDEVKSEADALMSLKVPNAKSAFLPPTAECEPNQEAYENFFFFISVILSAPRPSCYRLSVTSLDQTTASSG